MEVFGGLMHGLRSEVDEEFDIAMNEWEFVLVENVDKIIEVIGVVLGVGEDGFGDDGSGKVEVSKLVGLVSSDTVDHAEVDDFRDVKEP
jgi:hypothetical protein